MHEPSQAVVQILAEAYRSIGGNRAAAVCEPPLAEVARIIRIYAEGMKARHIDRRVRNRPH